jgi:hypothetical protein
MKIYYHIHSYNVCFPEGVGLNISPLLNLSTFNRGETIVESENIGKEADKNILIGYGKI